MHDARQERIAALKSPTGRIVVSDRQQHPAIACATTALQYIQYSMQRKQVHPQTKAHEKVAGSGPKLLLLIRREAYMEYCCRAFKL